MAWIEKNIEDLDHNRTNLVKYGGLVAVPVFLALLGASTIRGVDNEGIGLRGAIIAMMLLAIPVLAYLLIDLLFRKVAEVELTESGIRARTWWGGSQAFAPARATLDDRHIIIFGQHGSDRIKLRRYMWATPELVQGLESAGVPVTSTRREASAVMGFLVVFGILFGFFAVVFAVINIAARI